MCAAGFFFGGELQSYKGYRGQRQKFDLIDGIQLVDRKLERRRDRKGVFYGHGN